MRPAMEYAFANPVTSNITMENKNIVDELSPGELPDLLKWYEGMLVSYDGESKEVREVLRSQITITNEAIRRTQAEVRRPLFVS